MNDLTLLLDLYENSEETKLLIYTVTFCLVITASAKWRVELRAKKSATIETDALQDFVKAGSSILPVTDVTVIPM